ncbi:MAG: hypothetical protein EZS28_043905, partial [Streblomastix strix]
MEAHLMLKSQISGNKYSGYNAQRNVNATH